MSVLPISVNYLTSENQRQASKKWRSKNKEKIREYDKMRRQKNKAYYQQKAREGDARARKRVDALLGDKCQICGSPHSRLNDHEIHGKKHKPGPWYKLKHIKDFVRLCPSCHRGTHFCMNYLGMNWNEINKRIKLLD